MFLYKGDCLKNTTVIRGVRYVTVSHYSSDKNVFGKLGDLMMESFCAGKLHEVKNDSLSDSDIAIPNE